MKSVGDILALDPIQISPSSDSAVLLSTQGMNQTYGRTLSEKFHIRIKSTLTK